MHHPPFDSGLLGHSGPMLERAMMCHGCVQRGVFPVKP